MTQLPIVRRTEKLQKMVALLRDRKTVYLSAFFYSGKTILLDQLCETWNGKVLRFDSQHDDWNAFHDRVLHEKNALIVIDSVDHPSDTMASELATMLANLSEHQYAILSGRAQFPTELYSLCATGMITVLDKDFVMFDEEEIIQLFLEYGIELLPSDVRMIVEKLWGWAFSLHILAQQIIKHGKHSFSSLVDDTRAEIKHVLLSDVVLAFPDYERQLLYNLSPFERFSEEMARIVTGRNDAPRLMESIMRKSYMLLRSGEGEYAFIPIVRQALFSEMRNLYTQEYINGQYKRAALYYELQNQVPKALSYYKQLGDVEKIRDLLIRDTFNRPADGDYVELREGYAMLDRDIILAYPELMKGKCEIECLQGHAEESERWYQALEQFIRQTPVRDARHKTAEEAKAYLDLCLSQRGSKNTLKRLLAAAKSSDLRQSPVWRSGFSVSGNSVSLMNGGLDFCRWVQHGWSIYRLFKLPVELALGRGGSGVADVAIAERELEARLDGDYSLAMMKIREGIQRIVDNPDIYYAAIGIQSRIEVAQGNFDAGISMIDHAIATLSDQCPKRLRQNLEVFRMQLMLLRGDVADARNWLETKAPDETSDFIIMDRYQYMLKLRMYLILAQGTKIPFLATILRQYFERYDRPYMLIQLNLIEAIYNYRSRNEAWIEKMSAALSLARRYGLARVIADEGIAIIDMLNEMELPQDLWMQSVLALTRRQAALYPSFMKQVADKPMFTDREYQVYSLMIAGYKNAKIASILNISERTVKYFCGLIYQKLGVSTRAEALNRASEMGDIK